MIYVYQNQSKYKDELLHMVQVGCRVEIEALYVHGYEFLGRHIARKIVQNDYI
jgi:meiotic recombination protein SPO11